MDYCKRYQIKNGENNYVYSMKSINQNELNIKLSVIHIKQINLFYDKKTLEEIHYEFSFLKELLTIKSIIDYLGNLLKTKNMKIQRLNNSIYNIIFYDKDKNKEIKFFLQKNNDNDYEKINIENAELKKRLNNMAQEIQIQKSKIEKLEEIVQKLQANSENHMQSALSLKTPENGSYSKNINISNNYLQHNSVSVNNGFANSSIIHPLGNNNIKQSLFYKENNDYIHFNGDPNLLNNSKNISDEEGSEDECETFTAFNTKANQPIIVWITKNQNKNIFIKNWANGVKYCEKDAHNSKIDLLQYFYDDQEEDNNNEYIISLSKNDKQTLKIWYLNFSDKNGLSLKLKSSINKKIDIFCTFSNKSFLNSNYLITYSRFNDKRKITCWKLGDNLNILENDEFPIKLDTNNEINFLGTYYNQREQKLCLINCNNYDINVIEQPFIKEKKYISFKKNLCHLNALIFENNNNEELFDANGSGVVIWDYNNNSIKYEFQIDMSFDMCLWNDKYLWVSTNSGFKLINLEDKECENTIDEDNGNHIIRNGSKIRKIETPQEYESLILINAERKLVMWSK